MIKDLDQFVKPRTGIIDILPDSEREKIAGDFSGLVDDMLLAHARHVNTTNYVKFPNASSLMLTYPLENDRRLHIVVSSKQTEVGSVDSSKSIFVRETDSENRSYRWHEYHLTPGNPDVIRSDYYVSDEGPLELLEDEWNEAEFDDSFDDVDETPEEAREREEELRAEIENSEIMQKIRLNRQFEEQISANYLPADAEEIAKLRALVSYAEFIHP